MLTHSLAVVSIRMCALPSVDAYRVDSGATTTTWIKLKLVHVQRRQGLQTHSLPWRKWKVVGVLEMNHAVSFVSLSSQQEAPILLLWMRPIRYIYMCVQGTGDGVQQRGSGQFKWIRGGNFIWKSTGTLINLITWLRIVSWDTRLGDGGTLPCNMER
jgi:hypothetical protein